MFHYYIFTKLLIEIFILFLDNDYNMSDEFILRDIDYYGDIPSDNVKWTFEIQKSLCRIW
jgi:hypothetical protein